MRGATPIVGVFHNHAPTFIMCIVLCSLVKILSAAEIEVDQVEVYTLVHQFEQDRSYTHYAPSLATMIREEGREGILIDFGRKRIYWYDAHSGTLQSKRHFSDYRYMDQAGPEYSAPLELAPTRPAVQSVPHHWGFLQPVSREMSPGRRPCFHVRLANFFGDEVMMCAMQDPRAKGLSFLAKYYQDIPNKLKLLFEDADEIFLYSQGIVPVFGKRRGRAFELIEFRRWQGLRSQFYPPRREMKMAAE